MADGIEDILIDVSLSTGVEVITQRSTRLDIKRIGTAYRVYSLIEPVQQIASALRIAAYTDVASLLCHELIVEVATQQLSRRLARVEALNYEVIRTAQKYVLDIDFAKNVPEGMDYFYTSQYMVDDKLLSRDYTQNGSAMNKMVFESVSRGVDAFSKARELVSYSEAKRPRKPYDWSRSDSWLGKLNDRSGNIFWWQPPEIGLGNSIVANGTNYFGTFRRNSAEGYGCLEWESGARYYGQIRQGQVFGYGGIELANGARKFGYWPAYSSRSLGAYISSTRDRVMVGILQGEGLISYGRQIGLANGVESFHGLWIDGELYSALESIRDTYQNIADKMISPYTVELKAEYEGKARLNRAKQGTNDAELLGPLRQFL